MTVRTLCLSLASLLCCGVIAAQTSAPPPPSPPPPVNTNIQPPPAAPPVGTSTPPVNTTPPPIGTPQINGQPNPNTQQNQPRDANGNPVPSTATMVGGGQATPPAAPQPLDFGMLDTDKAGSLKADQARNDPWLRQNFRACDTNHNDEVTKSEYEKCSGR